MIFLVVAAICAYIICGGLLLMVMSSVTGAGSHDVTPPEIAIVVLFWPVTLLLGTVLLIGGLSMFCGRWIYWKRKGGKS